MKRGQLSLQTIFTIVGFVATPLVAYFGAQAATSDKINKLDTKTELVAQKNDIQDQDITEIKSDIKHMRDVLDQWAVKQGINIKQ